MKTTDNFDALKEISGHNVNIIHLRLFVNILLDK